MHEFALAGTGFNLRFGTTPNPWDETRHVGGSSGGSALAVALTRPSLSPSRIVKLTPSMSRLAYQAWRNYAALRDIDVARMEVEVSCRASIPAE